TDRMRAARDARNDDPFHVEVIEHRASRVGRVVETDAGHAGDERNTTELTDTEHSIGEFDLLVDRHAIDDRVELAREGAQHRDHRWRTVVGIAAAAGGGERDERRCDGAEALPFGPGVEGHGAPLYRRSPDCETRYAD